HPSNALRGVAYRPDQFTRLLGRVDHGHQQIGGSHVQQLLDHPGLARYRANHGRAGRRGDGLQLPEQGTEVIGRMLAIQQQPVKTAGSTHLGRIGVRHGHPEADLALAGLNGLLERIICGHDQSSLTPVSSTSCCHLAISPFWNSLNSAGVTLTSSRPTSSAIFFMAGPRVYSLMVWFSLSTISGGVFLGAKTAYHVTRSEERRVGRGRRCA